VSRLFYTIIILRENDIRTNVVLLIFFFSFFAFLFIILHKNFEQKMVPIEYFVTGVMIDEDLHRRYEEMALKNRKNNSFKGQK
jgi:hypothetical protein